MTLLDSGQISAVAFTVGTLAFTGVLVWTVWFALRMK